MAHGGSRKHPADCKCGNCPKMGRPKQERPTNANVASKVLAQAKAEKLWLAMIELECKRLGIGVSGQLLQRAKDVAEHGVIDGPDYQGKFSIIPLTNLLRYLEDRAYGRPVDTVNHLHDKPLEVNMTVSLAETIQKARKRAESK
jgi:hypothetical protein